MSAKCEHMNEDGTFKGGFDGCVLHMRTCEGHSEESARKICGKIAQQVAGKDPSHQSTNPPIHQSGLGPPLQARLSVAAPVDADRDFMVLPAGEHQCTFSQGGRPVVRRVNITPESAAALQEQLDAVQARSALKPFFDFDHDDRAASAWPTRFYWHAGDKPGLPGRQAGVYASAQRSEPGRAAIAGKAYQAFSMVFHVDHDEPAKVVSNPDADLNFGGLVNDPAFHSIAPIEGKSPSQTGPPRSRSGAAGPTSPTSPTDPLEAGDLPGHPFRGNQYASGEGAGGEHNKASAKAAQASAAAKESGDAKAHTKAAKAHAHAARLHEKEGNDEQADYHRAMAQFHTKAAAKAAGQARAERGADEREGAQGARERKHLKKLKSKSVHPPADRRAGSPESTVQSQEPLGARGYVESDELEGCTTACRSALANCDDLDDETKATLVVAMFACGLMRDNPRDEGAASVCAQECSEAAAACRACGCEHCLACAAACDSCAEECRELTEGNKGNEENQEEIAGSASRLPSAPRPSPLAPRPSTLSASARAGADAANQTSTRENHMQETLADLQAKYDKLKADVAGLQAANKAGNADAIAAKQSQMEVLEARMAAARAEQENADLRNQMKANREAAAEREVDDAVRTGRIAAKDAEGRARWKGLLVADPSNLVALQAIQPNAALGESFTRGATAAAGMARLEAREGPARVLKAYAALEAKNTGVHDLSVIGFKQKGDHAREMAALYARDIMPRWNEFRDMPLMAADVTDTNLGTLSGTLVAQRTLQLFKLAFPVISRVFTDFSDTPVQFKQTEATRIVIVPAVQTYSTAADSSGRPQGWVVQSAAQTKDVLITLDEHIGIPIVFDANTLASTIRRLFDEQAPAASYALAKYFVEKIYKLFTLANYNAYAAINGALVPAAYASYPVGLNDFARSTLAKIAAIFNPNLVPISDRIVLLRSDYYEQLATDPSLVTFFAGQQKPEIVTENALPKLAGFEPIEAPNLGAPNVTANLAGMALHKAAVIAKSRLSNDYTQALPGSSYGSVTTITDPDIGISVVLVQYVNHTGGYAEWRIQVMLGAAVGDNRGGLCIVSS